MNLKSLFETPPWDWPRDSAESFYQLLTNRRAKESDRVLAAVLAGDFTVINDKLSGALLGIVGNATEPVELRAKSAISLGPVLEHADTVGFDDPDDVPITELTFRKIQTSLQQLFADSGNPKEVRRNILEAAVRAPEDWHKDAVRTAYSSEDRDWKLTAVLAMRYVRGFDNQILEALNNPDPQIHVQAVEAAGSWELDAAWRHVAALVRNKRTPKRLLIAAIGAAGSIRPREAPKILHHHTSSRDEDIVEAAEEALMMAEVGAQIEDDEDDEDEWVN